MTQAHCNEIFRQIQNDNLPCDLQEGVVIYFTWIVCKIRISSRNKRHLRFFILFWFMRLRGTVSFPPKMESRAGPSQLITWWFARVRNFKLLGQKVGSSPVITWPQQSQFSVLFVYDFVMFQIQFCKFSLGGLFRIRIRTWLAWKSLCPSLFQENFKSNQLDRLLVRWRFIIPCVTRKPTNTKVNLFKMKSFHIGLSALSALIFVSDSEFKEV